MSKINDVDVRIAWSADRRTCKVLLNGVHAGDLEGRKSDSGYVARLQSNVSKQWYDGKHLVISQAVRQAITRMIEAEKIGG